MAKMVKALLNKEISVTVINSTDIVNEAIFLHKLSPVAAAALGRTLTMASIMGSELKSEDNILTIIINGDGELGRVTVCADSKGNVKGYVNNPDCETFTNAKGKLDVSRAVGKNGLLTVIKDIGLKEPFNASVRLTTGEIAEDFAHYFLISEQRATAVALGVLIGTDGKCENAAGVFLHVLPFCSEATLALAEKAIEKISSGVSGTVSMDIEGFINEYFKDFEIEYTETRETEYECTCTYERVGKAILSMGRAACDEILAEEPYYIEVSCHFCDRFYRFDREAVDELFAKRQAEIEAAAKTEEDEEAQE